MLLATDGVKKSLRDEDSLNNILDYYHDLASNKNDSLEADLTEQLQELTREGSGDDCTALIIHFPSTKGDNEFQPTQHESSDGLEIDSSYANLSEQINGHSLEVQGERSTFTIKKKGPNFSCNSDACRISGSRGPGEEPLPGDSDRANDILLGGSQNLGIDNEDPRQENSSMPAKIAVQKTTKARRAIDLPRLPKRRHNEFVSLLRAFTRIKQRTCLEEWRQLLDRQEARV